MDAILGRQHSAKVKMSRSAGLSVQGITRIFDGTPAVNDVSFDVQPGELVALVGASGSGKTTSLRIVAGYESPDRGRVMFDGVDITMLPPERRGFGMVFQHYALFPHMSVAENVAFGLEARGVAKRERLDRALQALRTVGLEGKGQRRIQQLSGGEQQRVALARAVVIEPKVLLLDEPLSNLDPTLRESTRDELRDMLHRVGAPALFVTHDQEDAFAVADRIVLLSKGRVLQVGSPWELYHHPASRDVASLIGKATLVRADDRGDTAAGTIGGGTHIIPVHRSTDMPLGTGAYAVFRPEALTLVSPDDQEAWVGEVVASRFAGSAFVHRVALSETVTIDVVSPDRATLGGRVGVRVKIMPVPLVPSS